MLFLLYMSKKLYKINFIVLVLAVILVTALFAIGFISFASNDRVAYAADDIYGVSLTENTAIYNGKAIAPPLSVTKNGAPYSEYTVSYLKGEDTLLETPKDVGVYTVKVEITSVIPSIVKTFTYTVTPKPLEIHVPGNSEFIYSGEAVGYSVYPVGLCGADTTEILVTYHGNIYTLEEGVQPINADSYTLTFRSSNDNYSIGNIIGVTELNIAKRMLTVKANDAVISMGGTPELSYNILGFVEGEDESVLENKPTVSSNATAVGVHNLRASGGVDENYDFTYQEGALTINAVEASGSIVGTSITLNVSGVFRPYTEYTGTTLDVKSESAKEIQERVRRYRMLSFATAIKLMYQIDTVQGAQLSDKVTVSMDNVTIESDSNYVIVVIAPNGVITQITKYKYLNGNLTFTAPNLGTVLIYKEAYNAAAMYIAIGIILLFIVALVIASRVGYIRDKQDADAKSRKNSNKNTYKW